jgi:HlyD family secretion protein
MRKLIIGIAGLVLLGALAWAVASRGVKTEEERPIAERPAIPTKRVVSASGRIESISEEIPLAAEIPGRLVELLVEEGAKVSQGQPLARLDAREYRAQVDSAEALVRQKEAELQRLQNGSREQERREARALTREAEALLENMRTERDRRAGLFRSGDIAREEVERAERQLEVAQARFEAATERQRLIEAAPRDEDLARAQAELALAEARAASTRILLGKTVIHAPIGGVILRRHLRVGEVVAASQTGALQPIYTLGDLSRLRVRAEIDELDIGRVQRDDPAYVTIDAYGDRRFPGRVVRLGQLLGRKTLRSDNPAEKTDTKILEVLIDLDPVDDLSVRLLVGLRVQVFLPESSAP